jgi:hypothetical protein
MWILMVVPVAVFIYFVYRWATGGFSWFDLGGVLAGLVGAFLVYRMDSGTGTPPGLEYAVQPVSEYVQTAAGRVRKLFQRSKHY